jgi:hypothetical protein
MQRRESCRRQASCHSCAGRPGPGRRTLRQRPARLATCRGGWPPDGRRSHGTSSTGWSSSTHPSEPTAAFSCGTGRSAPPNSNAGAARAGIGLDLALTLLKADEFDLLFRATEVPLRCRVAPRKRPERALLLAQAFRWPIAARSIRFRPWTGHHILGQTFIQPSFICFSPAFDVNRSLKNASPGCRIASPSLIHSRSGNNLAISLRR